MDGDMYKMIASAASEVRLKIFFNILFEGLKLLF